MIVNFNTYTDQDLVAPFIYQTIGNTPIDLTGNSLKMQVRLNAADPNVYIECSTANGLIVVTNAPSGAFTLSIPLSQLLNLSPAVYTHSLIMTVPNTFIRSGIWRGSLTHVAGPTRWTLGQL